jgi:hypothetical protein
MIQTVHQAVHDPIADVLRLVVVQNRHRFMELFLVPNVVLPGHVNDREEEGLDVWICMHADGFA